MFGPLLDSCSRVVDGPARRVVTTICIATWLVLDTMVGFGDKVVADFACSVFCREGLVTGEGDEPEAVER